MDPRIKAILAQYENEEKAQVTKNKPQTPEPPKSLEEWLERSGFVRWPVEEAGEKEFNISVASVGLGSLDDIMKDLGYHARILCRLL